MTWQTIKISIPGENGGGGVINQFGSAERSRIEWAIEELGAIKSGMAEGTVSKEVIIKALTVTQKALARTHLGDDIYQKCEHNPPEKPDHDCQLYEKMIK